MADAAPGKKIELLLVEDNLADVRLTEATLRQAKVVHRLHVMRDGESALQFLRREAPYADAPRPHLILLDLNLPRLDGRALLAQIRQDARFARIPVVILTGSEDEEDIRLSYDLHVNSYITKPLDQEGFVTVVRVIKAFWLGAVRLPSQGTIE